MRGTMNLVKKILTALFLMAFVGGQVPAYADGTSPQRAMTGEGTSMDVAGSASGGAFGTDVPWWTVGLGAAALAAVIVVIADDDNPPAAPDPDPDPDPIPSPTTTSTSTSTTTSSGP